MEEIRKFIFMADQIILIGNMLVLASRTHHEKRREETGMTVVAISKSPMKVL
jgi:hypothetical protein